MGTAPGEIPNRAAGQRTRRLPNLSAAWSLGSAADAFTSDQDRAAIAELDRKIQSKRKEWARSWMLPYQAPTQTGYWDHTTATWKEDQQANASLSVVQRMPGWEFPAPSSAEEADLTAADWSLDRIYRWAESRHRWLRCVALYDADLFTVAEIQAGARREDWTDVAVSKAIDDAIERRQSALQGEIDVLTHRRDRLSIAGLWSTLKSKEAIAYARAGSIRAPIDVVQGSFWNTDDLIFNLDDSSILAANCTLLLAHVEVLPSNLVPAPQKKRQSPVADKINAALETLDMAAARPPDTTWDGLTRKIASKAGLPASTALEIDAIAAALKRHYKRSQQQ